MLASELPEAAPSDPTGPRFRVEDIYPSVDGGRTPIKRIFGEVNAPAHPAAVARE